MANSCSSSYIFIGDEKEIKTLGDLMKDLESKDKSSGKYDYGDCWLGNLVEFLGGDSNIIPCRGTWGDLEYGDGCLKFCTETAWSPCDELWQLVCKKFTSLKYYFQSEETGCDFYITNDSEGLYYPERFHIDLCTPEERYEYEYFRKEEEMFGWFKESLGIEVNTIEEIEALDENWREENEDAYCHLHRYNIIDN